MLPLFLALLWLAPSAEPPAAVDAAPAVAFKAPPAWSVLKSEDQEGTHMDLYEINPARTSGAPANVLMFRYKLQPGMGMKDADAVLAQRLPAPRWHLLGGVADGPHWKTYLLSERESDGTDYVYLYRIGMDDGYGVEEIYSFPLKASPEKDYALITLDDSSGNGMGVGIYCVRPAVKAMVDQFNAFTSTVTIDGINHFEAKAILIDPPADAKFYRRRDGRR